MRGKLWRMRHWRQDRQRRASATFWRTDRRERHSGACVCEVKGGRMHALLRFLALPSARGARRAALEAVGRSGAGPKTRFVELEGPRLLCTWALEAELAGPCLQLLRQLDLRQAQQDLSLDKLLTLLAQQPRLESEVALCRKCWGLQPKRKRETEKLLNEVNVLGHLEPCVDEFFSDPFAPSAS